MLLSYIDRIDRLRVSALFHQVHNCAQRILKLHAPDGTKLPTLRRDWTKRFLKRNLIVYKVKQKPIEINRAAINDPAAI
jgi:hypothetical protein